MIEFEFPEAPPEPPPQPVDPETRIADETRVEALKNDFIAHQQRVLFADRDALFRQQGDTALAGAATATAKLTEARDALLDQAANPAQRTMLARSLDQHLALAGEDIQHHLDRQRLAWQRTVAQDRLDLLRQQMALDHGDPGLLEGYARAGESAALDQARLEGLPSESDEARQMAAGARSTLYRSAIEGALAAGNHDAASALYDHAKGRLGPADAASLEPELRLSSELQMARAWLAQLAPPPSPEPAAFFDAPRLLVDGDAAHAAATAQNEADWSGNPTQQATNQHLIDVQFGKQKREIEQTRVRLDNDVKAWLTKPGSDGQAQTERPPFAIWKLLNPEQHHAVDIVLTQNARGADVAPAPGMTPSAGLSLGSLAHPISGLPAAAGDSDRDPNIIDVSGDEPATPDDDGRIAQHQEAQQHPSIQTPAKPEPSPSGLSKEEQARQVAEAKRQKFIEERRAELDRLARIKTSPRPTDKQFMPEDWERRLSKETLAALDASAKRHDVPRELLARVLWQESGFKEDSNRNKPVGRAKGIAGLEDGPKGVKAELQRLAGLKGDQARVRELQGLDIMNASQAVDMAAEYLRSLYERGGRTWPGAVAAFNFGPTDFANWISGRRDPTKSRSGKWSEARGDLQYVFRGNPKAFDEQ